MQLRICVDLPMRAAGEWEVWSDGVGLDDLGRAVEQAGLAGLAMSDHPAPGLDWLAGGGHHTFDPFAALAAIAAVTDDIMLLTNLAVAPYRSPYVTAKGAVTVDLISRGRLVLGVGPGYLEAEFDALGADFKQRGANTDQAIEQVRRAWSGEAFTGPSGSRHLILPRPARGSCPIWVGGNSRAAMRRVARHGDGWLPFLQVEDRSGVGGTDKLVSIEQVSERAEEIRAMRSAVGRSPEMAICLAPARIGKPELLLEFLDQHGDDCRSAGIQWITWQLASRTAREALTAIERVSRALRG